MRSWQHIVIWLASVSLAWAADSCFLTTDVSNIVPGRPVLLAWDGQVGSWWDVLLNTDVRTRASLVGSIARNVTQNAVIWLPPADIADADPDKLYAVQLWDLGRGTSCISKTFRFQTNGQPPQPLPAGPLVTTSASLSLGPIRVTATVATFTSGVEPSYTSAIPTTTTTSAPGAEPETPPKTNTMAIAIGVVFGTLVTVLVVLSVCLWRAKRKRARDRGTELASDDGKGGPGYDRDGASSPAPSSAITELESSAKAAEMPAEERPHEMPTGDGRLVAEMPAAPLAPVELPAELPASLLHLPPRPPSLVSDRFTGDSRRPSLEDYTVSPATLTRRRTSLTKS